MNVLENTIIQTPFGEEDSCAKLTIDDVTLPFIFHNISHADETYTLSFYVRSESEGSIMVGGVTINTTSEWTKHVVNFVADSENVPMYFKTAGLYYMYNSQLEIGGHATDWRPAIEDVDDKISVAISISEEGIRSEVSAVYATQDSLMEVSTVANQTATGFKWLVNGEDETSFSLTEAGAELIASTISLNGNVLVDGSMLVDGCVTADKINVTDLFAQEIVATNMTITGDSVLNGVTATNLTVTGDSTFEGTLNGATGSFSGTITAKAGDIAGYTISDEGILSEVSKIYSSYNGQGRIELYNTASAYGFIACDWGLIVGTDAESSLVYLGMVDAGYSNLHLQTSGNTNQYVDISSTGIANFYSSASEYVNVSYGTITASHNITSKGTVSGDILIAANGMYAGSLNVGSIESVKSYIDNNSFCVSGSTLNLISGNAHVILASHFRPDEDNVVSLGRSSYRWTQLYAGTATIETSDRNLKKDFRTFDENYENFFFDLKPTIYKFINGTSGRDHFGFISQDVEESLYANGFDDMSFGGFCKDVRMVDIGEDGEENLIPATDVEGNELYDYSLRYGEFISLNTYMIQKSYEMIRGLQEQLLEANQKIAEQSVEIEMLKEICAA